MGNKRIKLRIDGTKFYFNDIEVGEAELVGIQYWPCFNFATDKNNLGKWCWTVEESAAIVGMMFADWLDNAKLTVSECDYVK